VLENSQSEIHIQQKKSSKENGKYAINWFHKLLLVHSVRFDSGSFHTLTAAYAPAFPASAIDFRASLIAAGIPDGSLPPALA
jgi:hypothetical protein